MRALLVAVGLVALSSAVADAKPRGKSKGKVTATKRTSKHARQQDAKRGRLSPAAQQQQEKQLRIATRNATGQSIGAPWAGRLQDAAQLEEGDGYVIRRPWRAFGTTEAVEIVEHVVRDTLDDFPDAHVLAIGDMSAEHGGQITQHRSHQAGRDIDIGLIYNEKPASYPDDFVHATADNLDCAATFALVEKFYATRNQDGGVQVIFLDFNVQGLLYRWALDHDVSEDRLERIFQFPHGRGSSDGLVRHIPLHDNHIHVRFKCPSGDSACR